MKIILASRSPRRKEILSELFSDFKIITREIDESLPENMHPASGVELLARLKGEAVALDDPEALVISSDTLVELDGRPLGKPIDEDDAASMLRLLSGREHNVHTGVAVHYKGKVFSGVDSTAVRFKLLSEKDILDYVKTGEPMDKAGAYGIQGLGGRLVSGYEGELDTVIGLSKILVKKLVDMALKDDKEG